jgi:hypothetical protein
MLLAPVIQDGEMDDELDAAVVLTAGDCGVAVNWNGGGKTG